MDTVITTCECPLLVLSRRSLWGAHRRRAHIAGWGHQRSATGKPCRIRPGTPTEMSAGLSAFVS
jgi:hypothetical protein